MVSMDDEIQKCFEENPNLYKKSMDQIARFFMIQGEMRYAHLSNIQRNRAEFYRRQLRLLDEEVLEKADQELEKARG